MTRIKDINFWYYVDSNPECFPDYIADVSSETDLSLFPSDYFDLVLSANCPLFNQSDLQYTTILKKYHRIIKKDGTLCLTELPHNIYPLLSESDVTELSIIVKRHFTEENLESLRKHFVMGKLIKETVKITDPIFYAKFAYHFGRKNIINVNVYNEAKEQMISNGLIDPKIKYSNEEFNKIFGFHYGGKYLDFIKILHNFTVEKCKKFLSQFGYEYVEIKSDILYAKAIKN